MAFASAPKTSGSNGASAVVRTEEAPAGSPRSTVTASPRSATIRPDARSRAGP